MNPSLGGLPRSSKGKRPSFQDSAALDQMMSMIMVLASELSVLADRVDLVERVAAKHGIHMPQGDPSPEFDQPALEAREERRQQMLRRLFYLMRKDAEEVDGGETDRSYLEVLKDLAE